MPSLSPTLPVSAQVVPPLWRREAIQISILVASALLLGAALQPLLPQGPAALLGLSAIGGAALAAAALILRGSLRTTVGGYRFAAVVLFALAAGSAFGTLILQGRPEQFYRETYGGLAGPILALGLDDIFHGLPFSGLVALLIAGLVVSAARRWPLNLRNAGFFTCHLGLLVTLGGTAASAMLSAKGRLDLRAGEGPVTEMAVQRGGVPTGERAPLGFAVALDSFSVERYGAEHRVALYRSRAEGGHLLEASFEPAVGARQRLPGGDWFVVEELYPDFVMEERVVGEGPGGAPALLVAADGREVWLGPGERAGFDGAAVIFDRGRPADPAAGPRHSVSAEGGTAQAIEPGGAAVALAGGLRVRALRFFPAFSYDIESKTAVNTAGAATNPALEVEIEGTPGAQRRWLFARMPDYGHGGDGPRVVYHYLPEAPRAETVVRVSADDRTVAVRKGGGERVYPHREGLAIEEAPLRFGPLYASAVRERRPGSASAEPKNPAARLRIHADGAEEEALFVAQERSGFPLAGGRALTFEKREDEPKAFVSQVTLRRGDEEQQATLAVNAPLSMGGWALYQANYNPRDPSYSGIDVVYDPGVPWVFAGFALIGLGVIYVFNVQPRLRGRREGRA